MDINITRLNEVKNGLLTFFGNQAYSKGYIQQFRAMFNRIETMLQGKGNLSYEEIFQDLQLRYAKGTLNYYRIILSAVMFYDKNGFYPEGKIKPQILQTESSYELLSGPFRTIIDSFRKNSKACGLTESTIKAQSSSGITFFTKLQQKNIFTLEKITEASVLQVFIEDGVLLKGTKYKSNVKQILSNCLGIKKFDEEEILRVIHYLPLLPHIKKNIQFLTESEYVSLKKALLSDDQGICYRDKAICLLAMFTGLRRSDILKLTLESIDWEHETISIVQQKTSAPMTLPLMPVVGNAVYDYITKERPTTETREIFINKDRPYSRLKYAHRTIDVVMNKCGIRQKASDRKGFHLLRHHLATELLSKNVPLPVISNILGHSSPNSTEVYLNTDLLHLKECSLSIKEFPIALEVLK